MMQSAACSSRRIVTRATVPTVSIDTPISRNFSMTAVK
jgi:hypothetical protein